jgi:hypothetical protein
VDYGCAGDSSRDAEPDLTCPNIHAKSRNAGQPIVERRTGIPEAVRSAGQAPVTGFYRPARAIVPAHRRTIECCLWAFAAHLVKAPTPAMPFIAPFLYKAAGVIVRTAFALIVDNPAIGKKRTMELINGG